MCGSVSGTRDLEPDPAVVGHRLQVVDRVQLAALVGRVVHAGHAAAELEPQVGVVAQVPDQRGEVLAGDVEGDLAAVDDDLGDHVEGRSSGDPSSSRRSARRPGPTSRRTAGRTAPGTRSSGSGRRSRRCRRCPDAEHALADLEHLGRCAPARRRRSPGRSATSCSASVAAEATSGADPVCCSALVPASGSDSPCGSAPLTGAFASDSALSAFDGSRSDSGRVSSVASPQQTLQLAERPAPRAGAARPPGPRWWR